MTRPLPFAVALSAALVLGCEPGARNAEPTNIAEPSFDWVYEPTCFEQNEIGFTTVEQHGCAALNTAVGFNDQALTFDIKYEIEFGGGVGSQEALAVFEYRYLATGSFGIEYRAGAFGIDLPDTLDTYDPPAFTMQFPRELAASEIIGFAIICDESYTDVEDCYENATSIHTEPRICIDNQADGEYADAAARCAFGPDDAFPLNELPIATITSVSEESTTETSATWSFQGTGSDPDGGPTSLAWEIRNPLNRIVATSSASSFSETFTMEGTHTVRLLVNDGEGGIDLQKTTFQVVFAEPPPPDPLSAAISGPAYVPPNESCDWSSTVSGGTQPYAYEWRRDGQPVGTGSTYTANTGTTDFTLSLLVTDAGTQSDSDSLAVDVTTSVQACFSLE